MIDVIYCGAGGNRKIEKVVSESGLKFGARLPGKHYIPIDFADQDWKNPDRAAYMEALSEDRPQVATVIDITKKDLFDEAISWAEEAAKFVKTVIIIPKLPGIIYDIPETINGAQIRLGYSVPSSYGATKVAKTEFGDRPVHLLGGGPGVQMKLYKYSSLNVVSVDANQTFKLAKRNMVWQMVDFASIRTTYVSLESLGYHPATDAPYLAFKFTCDNVVAAWKVICTPDLTQSKIV